MSVRVRESKNKSGIVPCIFGVVCAVTLILLGAALCTELILKEHIAEKYAKIILLGFVLLGSMAGGVLSFGRENKSLLPSAMIYIAALLVSVASINILFMDGIASGFWSRVVILTIGAILALVICMQRHTNKRRKII